MPKDGVVRGVILPVNFAHRILPTPGTLNNNRQTTMPMRVMRGAGAILTWW